MLLQFLAISYCNNFMNRDLRGSSIPRNYIEEPHLFSAPIQVHLSKQLNPEHLPLGTKQENEPSSLEDSVKSPFQTNRFLYDLHKYSNKYHWQTDINWKTNKKDQFILGSHPANRSFEHSRLVHTHSSKQLIRQSTLRIQERQNLMQIDRFLGELLGNKEISKVKRSLSRLNNIELRRKAEQICGLFETFLVIQDDLLSFKQQLVRLIKANGRPSRPLDLSSSVKIVREIQHLLLKKSGEEKANWNQSRIRAGQSVQRMRQVKEMRLKHQKQSKQLWHLLEQEKNKMKLHYQQIYCKIYQQNNKIKNEFEMKVKQAETQQNLYNAAKQKHQKILLQISEQLKQIKIEQETLRIQKNQLQNHNQILNQQITKLIQAPKQSSIVSSENVTNVQKKKVKKVEFQSRSKEDSNKKQKELEYVEQKKKQLKTLEQILSKLYQNIEFQGKKIQEMSLKITHLTRQAAQLEIDKGKLQASYYQIQHQKMKAEAQLKKYMKKQEQLKNKVTLLKNERKELKSSCQSIAKQVQQKHQQLTVIQKKIKQQTTKFNLVMQTDEVHKTKMQLLQKQVQQQNNLLFKINQEKTAKQMEVKNLQSKLKILDQDHTKANQKNQKIKEKVKSMQLLKSNTQQLRKQHRNIQHLISIQKIQLLQLNKRKQDEKEFFQNMKVVMQAKQQQICELKNQVHLLQHQKSNLIKQIKQYEIQLNMQEVEFEKAKNIIEKASIIMTEIEKESQKQKNKKHFTTEEKAVMTNRNQLQENYSKLQQKRSAESTQLNSQIESLKQTKKSLTKETDRLQEDIQKKLTELVMIQSDIQLQKTRLAQSCAF